jgi:hypothetical protein
MTGTPPTSPSNSLAQICPTTGKERGVSLSSDGRMSCERERLDALVKLSCAVQMGAGRCPTRPDANRPTTMKERIQ